MVRLNKKKQKEPKTMRYDCLQLTEDSVISETGQSVRSFVVRELRQEPGPVPTLPPLTVVQIVREKLLKLKLARLTIVQVRVDAYFFLIFIFCAMLIQYQSNPVAQFAVNKNARIIIVRLHSQIVLSKSANQAIIIEAIKRIFFNRG